MLVKDIEELGNEESLGVAGASFVNPSSMSDLCCSQPSLASHFQGQPPRLHLKEILNQR